MKCPSCKTDNPAGAKVCTKCGKAMPPAKKKPAPSKTCPSCKAKTTDMTAVYCPKCSKPFIAPTPPPKKATKKPAPKKKPAPAPAPTPTTWDLNQVIRILVMVAIVIFIICCLAFGVKSCVNFFGTGTTQQQTTTAATVPATTPNTTPSQVADEQSYVPHPTRYESTGISGSKTWDLTIGKAEFAVIGGTSVTVDGKLYQDGAYVGVGEGSHKITSTNGFLSIIPAEWAAQEFDFRVAQAVTYGWAHNSIDRGPIPS